MAKERVEEIYERAVANVPPGGEKRHWRRYIFVWLNYALFEEMATKVRLSSSFTPLLPPSISALCPLSNKCSRSILALNLEFAD